MTEPERPRPDPEDHRPDSGENRPEESDSVPPGAGDAGAESSSSSLETTPSASDEETVPATGAAAANVEGASEPGGEPSAAAERSARAKILAWWATIVGICLIVLLGSTFVTRSYLKRRTYEMENWRPPHLAKLEEDLVAINRDGREVRLGDLEGKVFVAGYNYTDCPAGCLGLASVMKDLHEEFGHLDRFHLLSISVDPKSDTPEKMDAWVKERGVDAPNWWFLTGDEELIRNYMVSQFRFFAVEEITDPEKIAQVGRWSHDLRLALVDGKANVRGYYDVLNTQYGEDEIERLERDIRMVLDPDLKLKDFQEEP